VHEDPVWMMPPVRCSAMDPSYTNGGDRTVQFIFNYGQTVNGLWTIHIDKYITIHEDASIKVSRDYQVARKFRDNCMAEQVSPENAAIDSTGAGSVLLSIIHEEWSTDVRGINFSGYPTDMMVSTSDPVSARHKYDRRVTELWCVGKEFVKYGQIKGVNDDLARELKARQYDTVKGPEGLKMAAESKKDMKKRIGFSPDYGDTFAMSVDLCRFNFGALAGGMETGMRKVNHSWEKQVEAADAMYANADYSNDEQEAVNA
jgi:hypothetical protein